AREIVDELMLQRIDLVLQLSSNRVRHVRKIINLNEITAMFWDLNGSLEPPTSQPQTQLEF
ncbi:MAG TPA: hypothetical protein VIW67_18950, partial [Terriglobales bacterium]